MKHITREEDFLLFCDLPGFGNSWLNPTGLFIDVIGFALITVAAFRVAGMPARQAELEDKLDQLSHTRTNLTARSKDIEASLEALTDLDAASELVMSDIRQGEAHWRSAKMLMMAEKAKREEQVRRNRERHREIADLQAEKSEVDQQLDVAEVSLEAMRGKLAQLSRTEERSILVGGGLIIFGFLVQIVGSWPC